MTPRIFRIHPGIGIGRVGNAELTDSDGFFVGPETPGIPANFDLASGKFRAFKTDGAVKRQAARFRVWEYEVVHGKRVPLREVRVGELDVVDVEWRVTLANRKASFFEFDGPAGEKDEFGASARPRRNDGVPTADLEMEETATVRGVSGPWTTLANRNTRIPIDELGRVRTDEAGRLLVAGAKGQSATTQPPPGRLPHYANNPGWFDDVADGPVEAVVHVRLGDGSVVQVTADPAWVVTAPPDFGPAVPSITTLYDAIWDVAVRLVPLPSDAGIYDGHGPGGALGLRRLKEHKEAWAADGMKQLRASFVDEVWPLLRAAYAVRWVHEPVFQRHKSMGVDRWTALAKTAEPAKPRQDVFARLRDPDDKVRKPRQMPKSRGDLPYGAPDDPRAEMSVTRVQYALLRQWQAGAFVDGPDAPPPPVAAEAITPEGLDRAALEAAVGGAFYPGIEASWLVRSPKAWSEPFRLAPGAKIGPVEVRPGFLTQQMAVPWQADFNDCKREQDGPNWFAWWPSQRPDDVFVAGQSAMRPWRRGLGGRTPGDGPPFPSDRHAMVAGWSTRGFVVEDGDELLEREGPP